MSGRRSVVATFLGIVTGAVLLVAVMMTRPELIAGTTAKIEARLEPEVTEWPEASPSAEGLDEARLRELADRLAARGTTSLLVVRGGRLVYERYPRDGDPARLRPAAALTKALAGSMVLARAVTDDRLELSDPARRYLPVWSSDPLRSRIRVRDLAFHASGLEDVDFVAGKSGGLTGWKRMYYESPGRRFSMAVTTAPVEFEPGTAFTYSGVAYYALADVLGRALHRNIEEYLREEVYEPIGIPSAAWRISYGRGYPVRGETLYALGSGGRFTARAAARIGQLMLDGGCWEGESVLASGAVDEVLARGAAGTKEWAEGLDGSSRVVPGAGWWLNRGGIWPYLPDDAFAGMGTGGQLLLVVPSEDLVAVRTGSSGSFPYDGDVARRLKSAGEAFFRPLVEAVEGPSSRERAGSGPSCWTGDDVTGRTLESESRGKGRTGTPGAGRCACS